MKTKIVKFTLIAFTLLGLCAPASNAAEMTFSAEEYSDAAISTTGTLVGALNVGATETVNTVPFTGITTGYTNPIALGDVSLDAFGGGGNSIDLGAAGPLTNNFFYACAAGYLTFSGLTEGQAYELQLVMSETRALNMEIWGDQTTNTGASDIVVEHGNSASKLVTGTFMAGAAGTQSLFIQVIPGCPGHFNALQLRAISELPEPPEPPEPDPVITFDVEDYADAAISTAGALVGALNVGATETVNTVPFTGITTGYTNPIVFAGGVTLDAFGGGGTWYDCGAPGPLTHNFVFACDTGYLTFSGLTEGQAYELQFVMSDRRDLNLDIWGDQTTNTGASDLSVDHGNSASKLVTLTFTADATGTRSLYIEVIPGCPGHFNALQLRAVGSPRPLVITSVTKAEAETSIVFDSVPGAYYIVEFSYDLTTWLELTDSLLATDVTTTFIDDAVNIQAEEKVFYRVRRQE